MAEASTVPGLVVDTSFLGDVLCVEPLVRRLAEQRSGAPLDVLTTPAAAPLLEGNPAVREVLRFDKRGADRGLRGLLRTARRLRARGYGAVWCTHRSWRTAALLALARIPERVGFDDASGAWLYTRRVPYRKDLHEVERNLLFAGGGAWERPRVFPTAEERARAAELAPAGPFVALAPGSVWATKRWPREHWQELAVRLVGAGLGLALVGAPDEAEDCAAVAAAARRAAPEAAVADLAGRTSLRESHALLERAACVVANDSLPMHLGVAAGAPVVALYCSTVPEFGFAPRGPRDLALGVDGLDCRPCGIHGHHACPRGHFRCGWELTPDRVAAAVLGRAAPESMSAT